MDLRWRVLRQRRNDLNDIALENSQYPGGAFVSVLSGQQLIPLLAVSPENSIGRMARAALVSQVKEEKRKERNKTMSCWPKAPQRRPGDESDENRTKSEKNVIRMWM